MMTLLEHDIRAESPYQQQRRRRWHPWAALAGMAGCLLSGAAGGAIVLALHGTATPAAATGHQAVPRAAGPGQAAAINATRLAAAIGPAVVDISTRLDALEGGGQAAGTGMIISRNGEIVTNNHVVQGADTVTVTIRGHGSHPAAVIGTDPAADIAVLRVSGLSGLPAVRFGNSARLPVGTQVLAIGNALGLGGNPTVSQGIISATGRAITATDQAGSNPERLHGLLQTDAPIAPGNSGGPLVNAAGRVIGMDTAAASAGTGASLGFAIPANTIQVIAGQITMHKNAPGLVFGRPPFLGVEIVNSSQAPNAAGPFGVSGNPFGLGPAANTPRGVIVAAVDPGSPAARAGIASGDVITAIDGHATPTAAVLTRQVSAHKPGQVVSVTVSTQNGSRTVQVRLGMGPIR